MRSPTHPAYGRIATLALAAIVAAAGPASGDQITLGGIKYPNVKVIGLRDGKLMVQMAAGQRDIDLADVQGLELDAYPDMAKADAALDKREWAAAADIYEPLLDKVQEDYLKVLVGAKLVASLDRAGRFEQAVGRYAALLRLNQGPLVQTAVPTRTPEDEAARASAMGVVDGLLAGEADPVVRKFLEETKKRLAGEEVAGPDPGVGPALVVGEGEAARDLVQEDLDAGRFQVALDKVAPRLNMEKQDLSRLLRQHGDALAGLGRHEDALVSYMRVVVHFRPGTTPNYLPAMMGAATSFHALGQSHHAKALLEEAFKIAVGNEEAVKKITELRRKIG